jgi:hypothetical protein
MVWSARGEKPFKNRDRDMQFLPPGFMRRRCAGGTIPMPANAAARWAPACEKIASAL